MNQQKYRAIAPLFPILRDRSDRCANLRSSEERSYPNSPAPDDIAECIAEFGVLTGISPRRSEESAGELTHNTVELLNYTSLPNH
jgi:hypothetical protein